MFSILFLITFFSPFLLLCFFLIFFYIIYLFFIIIKFYIEHMFPTNLLAFIVADLVSEMEPRIIKTSIAVCIEFPSQY